MALWRLRGGGALAGYVGGVTSELFRARVIWTARLVGVTLIYTVFAGIIAFRRTPCHLLERLPALEQLD